MALLWVVGERRLEESLTCVFFGLFGRKKKNQRLFENEEMSNQRLKSSILNNLSLWIKVYIDGSTMPSIDFVDWLGSC